MALVARPGIGEPVAEAAQAAQDTERGESGLTASAIVGIVITILVVGAIAVAIFLRRR